MLDAIPVGSLWQETLNHLGFDSRSVQAGFEFPHVRISRSLHMTSQYVPSHLTTLESDSESSSVLVPSDFIYDEVYWNMTTHIKYTSTAPSNRQCSDALWLRPIARSFAAVNYLVNVYLCLDVKMRAHCDLRHPAALEAIMRNIRLDLRSKVTVLRRLLNHVSRNCFKAKSSSMSMAESVSDVFEEAVLRVLDTVRNLHAPRTQVGSEFVESLKTACHTIASTSVLAGYKLQAAGLHASGRLHAAAVTQAIVFHEDLGLHSVEVLSSLLRRLELSSPHSSIHMAELGVHRAETSVALLGAHPQLRWLGLDTYEGKWAQYLSVARDALALFVLQGRATLRVGRTDAVGDDDVPRGSLDVLFVDADHSESQVRSDLQRWSPRVRSGGLIIGHDYCDENYIGVSSAVHTALPSGVSLHIAPGHIFFWYAS